MDHPLDRSFYARDAIHLAPALIGTVQTIREGHPDTPLALISLMVTITCSARALSATASKTKPTDNRTANIEVSYGVDFRLLRQIRSRLGAVILRRRLHVEQNSESP